MCVCVSACVCLCVCVCMCTYSDVSLARCVSTQSEKTLTNERERRNLHFPTVYVVHTVWSTYVYDKEWRGKEGGGEGRARVRERGGGQWGGNS